MRERERGPKKQKEAPNLLKIIIESERKSKSNKWDEEKEKENLKKRERVQFKLRRCDAML